MKDTLTILENFYGINKHTLPTHFMEESVTTDLSRFGWREIGMAGELLTRWADYPNEVDLGEKVQLMMNFNSGNVFLTDEDTYRVFMICDNADCDEYQKHIEEWVTCINCGAEDWLPLLQLFENGECAKCLGSSNKH